MRKISVVDVETTGTNPGVHEIIEVAVVQLADDLSIEKEWSSRVKPVFPELADPKAFEINGYNEKDWAEAPRLGSVAVEVICLVSGHRIAGHNVSFDLAFMRKMLSPYRLISHEIESLYAPIDTATLAYPLYRRGLIKGIHLSDIAEHFGITNEQPHRALGDARCTAKVLKALLE